MVNPDFEPSIPSRPVYGTLTLTQGSAHFQGLAHLIVADGEGGHAVSALFDSAAQNRQAMLGCTQIIYIPGANGTDLSAQVQGLGAAQFRCCPSFPAALPLLTKVLAQSHMRLQIYATGTEGLIGQVAAAAQSAGFVYEHVQAEHRGSLARRVQCVHCKGINEHVTLDPFVCGHCGLNLFVRDHFSRRIAAFQGVNIDAEDPGLVPPSVERFT
jgi:hypothetical protein